MTSDARETAISPIGLLQLRKAASGIVS
jgi:hypothetical protein